MQHLCRLSAKPVSIAPASSGRVPANAGFCCRESLHESSRVRKQKEARRTIDAMNQTMVCRGPDAGGLWVDGHAALGHRRLAVIDVEGGKQPMAVEHDGQHAAVR